MALWQTALRGGDFKGLAVALAAFSLPLAAGAHSSGKASHGEGGSGFIPNRGQWPGAFAYRLNAGAAEAFVNPRSVTYVLRSGDSLEAYHHRGRVVSVPGHAVEARFLQARARASIRPGEKASDTHFNFFLGNDPQQWQTSLHAYAGLDVPNLYPGVDLEWRYRDGQLKYNLIADRPAALEQVALRYRGADSLALEDSALVVYTSLGAIREAPPVAWQTQDQSKVPVRVGYRLEGNTLRFSVEDPGALRAKKALTVDPEVVFASYSGSLADNWGFTATYDRQGRGYSGGIAFGSGFPTTRGAFQDTFAGGTLNYGGSRDAAILCYTPDGTDLAYATYIGGAGNEQPHSMVVNSQGELLVMGTTRSGNFPMRGRPFQSENAGQEDIYLARLGRNGALLSSTYLGGKRIDGLNGHRHFSNFGPDSLTANYGDTYRGEVKVDSQDRVWVASCTYSQVQDAFPLESPIQETHGGQLDGCLLALSPELDRLEFSTYLGGSQDDAAYSLDLNPANGHVSLCGGSRSGNFPTTAASWMPEAQGGVDGWLAVVDPAQRRLVASTYIGSEDYDQMFFVKRDKQNRLYVTGQSKGRWKSSPGTYQDGGQGQLIFRFPPSLEKVDKKLLFGDPSEPGRISLVPSAFMVDSCGRVYFSGWGGATNQRGLQNIGGSTFGLSTTPGAFQSNTDGSDFYLAVFNQDMRTLLYATFLGGLISSDHVDGGTSRFDPRTGYVYQSICAGCGSLSDFPTTPDAWSNRNQSPNCNNLLVKFDVNVANTPPQGSGAAYRLLPGESFRDTLVFTDEQADSILYSAEGEALEEGLEITPLEAQAGSLTLALRWNLACFLTRKEPFRLSILTRDNACPFPDSASFEYEFTVDSPANRPPVMEDREVRLVAGETLDLRTTVTDPDRDTVLLRLRSPAQPFTAFPNQVPFLSDTVGKASYSTRLQWETTCADITGPDSSLPLAILLNDDESCLEIGRDTAFFSITVAPPPTPPGYSFLCIDSVEEDEQAYQLIWDHPDTTHLVYGLLQKKVKQESYQTLDTVQPSTLSYWDTLSNKINPGDVCYRLIPVGRCGIRGDSSASNCIGQDSQDLAMAGYVSEATVRRDEDIRLRWLSYQKSDFKSYRIYKSKGYDPKNRSLVKIIEQRTDTQWLDTRVEVDSSAYCYWLETHTFCALPRPSPNFGCSVHLTGKSLPYRHELEWSPYRGWPNGVEQYEIEAQWGGDSTFRRRGLTPGGLTSFTDTSLDYDWGEYHYRIRAGQATGAPLTAESLSNEIELIQAPKVWVPNAFTPNQDGLNELFKLETIFVKTYRLQIFNRWGELVFETTDKGNSWDGQVSDLYSMDNVFVYILYVTGWDGTVKTQSGTITLLK